MTITYDKLFFQAFNCLPNQSKSLDEYSKDELIHFIGILKQGIETFNDKNKCVENGEFGLAVIATNENDLKEFQDLAENNFLPISKRNCRILSSLTNDFIDEYLQTGVNHLRSEYAMIILLKHVQTLTISNEKTFTYNNRKYKYQLKIVQQDESASNDEFLTKIRQEILGDIFSIDHDDHASIPSLPAPKQPQFVSIFPHTQIACSALPGRRDLKIYQQDLGITHILTLLNAKEVKNNNICSYVESIGITSIHLPIEGAELSVYTSSQATVDVLRDRLPMIIDLLSNSTKEKPVKMLVHCAAGLHRTGTITYLLLRFCRFTIDQSLLIINRTRSITARQVGKKRIDAVEYVLRPKLL